MDFHQINLDHPVDVLLERLGIKVRHNAFRCPFHDDRTESGSVFPGKDGRLRWRCHVCDISGDSIDLIKRLKGLQERDAAEWITGRELPNGKPPNGHKRVPPPPPPPPLFTYFPPDEVAKLKPGLETPVILRKTGSPIRPLTPVFAHRYRDAKGVRLVAIRYVMGNGGKSFLPVRWNPERGFVSTSWQEGEDRLFYREPELAKYPEKTVLVLEGEKCVDLVANLPAFDDYVVITWQGGSKAARHQPWAKLRHRRILFWPDADMPAVGEEQGDSEQAMRKAAKLAGAPVMQIVVPLRDWTQRPDIKGYDVADLLHDLGGDALKARELMETLVESIEVEEPEQPQAPPPPEAEKDPLPWVMRSTQAKGEFIHPTAEANVYTWIKDLPRERGGYQGRLSRDVFTNEVLLDGELLDEGSGVREMVRAIAVRRVLDQLSYDKLRPIIGDVADTNKVNRLADELRTLTWDGEARDLLRYAGVDVGPAGTPSDQLPMLQRWARCAGWRWLLGLVKRILEPGAKHDGVLVLEGVQGSSKTAFFHTVGRILGRDLFVEVDKLSRDPDTQMLLQGKAVVELAEMTAQRKGDADSLKAMLTSQVDLYRRPYARKPEPVPRTCVFGGSTNEERYLKDMTGNRRYWIVPVVAGMRLDALAMDMPQLLAQAMHYITHPDPAFPSDAQNWLTTEEEVWQAAIAREREISWPQFAALDDYLDNVIGPEVSEAQIWDGLGTQGYRRSNELGSQLTREMEKRGWVHGRWHRAERNDRFTWKRPEVTDL